MNFDEYKKQFAKSGGDAVLKKHGKKYFSEMGKRSGEARRNRKTEKT